MQKIKRVLLGLTTLVLLFTLSFNSKLIVASGITPPEGNFIVSHKKTELIPGVEENEFIYNNSSGSNPVSGFAVDVKLGSNVGIMAATTNYNEKGTQTVLGMAEAAENATGRNIIAGINADLNWDGTGLSTGPMIVDGKVINDEPRDFFGIKKDGTAVLGRTSEYNEIKDELEQAVTARMGWLVTDGKVVATSTSLAPRSAVGIRADGSVILMMIEGRAFPRSNGIGLKDLAEIMVNMGAVTAANLDGGGSSTYVAKRPGVGQLEIRSHLSDGRERASISSLLVYGEEGDGVFDRAIIDTDADAYTPESTIQFNARGADSGGGPANLPANLTWELENNDLGTIDNNGLFESSGEEGEVIVLLKDDSGRTLGSHSVKILIPDEIEFRTSEFSFGFEESNDFGLRLLNNKQELKFKDGDIDWEIEIYDEESDGYELDVDNRLGKIENNIFTSNKDESIAGRITATVNSNKDLTRKLDIVVGQLPNVIFDFEDDEINDMWTTKNANGAEVNLNIVTRDSGEPVRFGDKSLRMDFDFRNIIRHPGGAYAALKPEIFETDIELKIPGTPTAIGMWVYATEEAQGIWLRGGVGTDGTTGWKALNFTDEAGGIDWVGWKFITLDFAGNNPPFTILDNQFIRLMITSNSFGGDTSKKPYGSVYIDDITVIYGYNPEDTKNPIIEDFNIYEDENNKINLKDNNQDVDFNNFTIETSFYDYVDDFTSGIDYGNVSILVDGVNYKEDEDNFYLSETDQVARLQNVYLDDGVHEVKVIVLDKEGNETSITRYITVNTERESLVYFENDLRAVLDKTHQMVLKAKNIENIVNFDLSFKISNEMKDFEVEFMDGFVGEVEYLNSINILNIKANKIGTTTSNEILKINVPISKDIKEGANIRYNLIKGTYVYDGEKETFNSFSFKPVVLAVKAPLVIKTNVLMVGQLGEIYVYDVEGNPVANAIVYEVSGSTEESIGETDENGLLITERYMENVESFRLIAKLDDDISFDFNGQSLDSTGEADGAPFAITHNGIADPHESKNITWLSNAFADNKDALIRFGFSDNFDENDSSTYEVVEGSNEMLVFTGSTTITDNYVINVNNVIVNNLEGGKEYKFQVGNGDVWSEVRTFKTVNKFGDVNFFILGDIQSTNYENAYKHSNAVGNDKVDYDFGIQVGDFVDDAGRYDHWYGILNAMSNSTIGDFDIVKLLGNHEFYGDPKGENAKAIFNTPDKKDYYSVEYGVVYIGVLSYDMNRESLTEKLEWMVEDANNSNARWKILVTHQPPYYTNPEGGNELISELLPGYAEQANFDFVISGHEHTYARTRPLTNGEIDTNGGVTYIIAGAFGEKGYPVSSTDFNFENVIGGLKHIYLSVQATGEKFQIEVFDASTNEYIDGLVREKQFDHEHNYILEGDRLVCYECQYSRPLEGYVGFVRDEEDNIMYHLFNQFHKGIYFWDEEIYYFDDNGHALTGINEVWGLETTFDKEGRFVSGGTGFSDIDGKTFYYENLEMVRYAGITKVEEDYYYFSSIDFSLRKGTYRAVHLNKTFYLDEVTGKAFSGINYYKGLKVETNIKGEVISGGTGFSYEDGKIYYYKDLDMQKTGYTHIGDDIYYIRTTTGEVVTGEYRESTYDEYGRLINGSWQTDSKGTKYTKGGSEGAIISDIYAKGFQDIEGDIYYFNEEGYLMTGTFYVDGFKVIADEHGVIEF